MLARVQKKMEKQSALACKGLGHELALALAERVCELALAVPCDDIVEPELVAVLVDTLRDLVASGIAQTREERHKTLCQWRCRMLAEDDRASR